MSSTNESNPTVALQAKFDLNEERIRVLTEQLNAAKKNKKLLSKALKEEKAKDKKKKTAPEKRANIAQTISVSYSCPEARRRAAANGVFSNLPGRYYVDNYANRRLGRVGLPIPSRMGK